jgi:hypothetical protein
VCVCVCARERVVESSCCCSCCSGCFNKDVCVVVKMCVFVVVGGVTVVLDSE